MRQAVGQGDGGEFLTSQKSHVTDMRQAAGQGDGGEFLTPLKSSVPDMRQGSGQGNHRLIRQECNQQLALRIH